MIVTVGEILVQMLVSRRFKVIDRPDHSPVNDVLADALGYHEDAR